MRAARILCLLLVLFPADLCSARTKDRGRPAPANDRVRPPAAAGAFYPADKAALAESIDRLFQKALRHPIDGKLVALLVPHAGLAYSGPVAAEGYKSMSAGWKTIVLVGPAHHVQVNAATLYARGSFATPLGRVPVDEALAAELLKDSRLFEDSPFVHAPEHAIEVQLPFLQRVFSDFKILPVLMNTNDPALAERIGEALGKAAAGRNALLVVSSDLSHYPPKEAARRNDLTLLRAAQRLDPPFLMAAHKWLMGRGEPGLASAACGISALMAGLAAARVLGADRAALWRYANSGELVPGSEKETVGYAAMAFTRTGKAPVEKTLGAPDRALLLAAARASLAEAFAKKAFSVSPLADDPDMNLPAAVFVTLRTGGELRGCVGSSEPRLGLRDAARFYARAAAFQDPRFKPLRPDELDKTRIEVSVLSPPRRVGSAADIRPRRDGVIVEKDGKTGLFLPDVWVQMPEKEEFLSELCAQKAGLPRDCWKDPGAVMSVFRTETFSEDETK